SLLDLNGPAAGVDKIAPLVAKVRDTLQESQALIHWTSDPADAEVFHALPLTGPVITPANQAAPNQSSTDQGTPNPTAMNASANRQLMGVLLVGSSRRPLIE